MNKLILITSLLILNGCSGLDIRDVDTKGKAPACVRQCAETYSRCMGNSTGAVARPCYTAYDICISTCPAN